MKTTKVWSCESCHEFSVEEFFMNRHLKHGRVRMREIQLPECDVCGITKLAWYYSDFKCPTCDAKEISDAIRGS